MAPVTGGRYLESLVKFVENQAERLIEGTLVLKLNPVGLRYVQSRLESLTELESLLSGAPVDYLRAYVSDLGDHRALEQLRRILRLLPSLKIVSFLPPLTRDPTPLCLLPFARLKVLELRGCNLSVSAAKGILELRFTLEKLICHNSTDALRHVFTSRITEVKDSPQWNRLSFVSCASNGLLLMDESLMLLSAVETLDLSRNKLAKVDNLGKCIKLKHLDLGFNNLKSISSFSEVSRQIVKLVLRYNALTSLRGIGNLKSLKGLDLSYNIISKFSEIEILVALPSLQNLWLEGNPICFARWFRAQVFSLFPTPDMLTLDDKSISKREFWKRQIIVASRHNRPASFGFYSPATDDADFERDVMKKKKRISRLVNIENKDQSTFSDQDSASSSNNDALAEVENAIADDVAEIENLVKRIELMKKEQSSLWLQEFEEWMNHASVNISDAQKIRAKFSSCNKNIHSNEMKKDEDLSGTSRFMTNAVRLSGDENHRAVLESDTSFADTSTVASSQQFIDRIGDSDSKYFVEHPGGDRFGVKNLILNHGQLRSRVNEDCMSVDADGSHFNLPAAPQWDDYMVSHSLLAFPGSPPQYKQDILHQRHYKEEEFLQLSAESCSVASFDSNTSCSDDSMESGHLMRTQSNQSLTVDELERNENGFSSAERHVADPADQAIEISSHASSCGLTSGEVIDVSVNRTDCFEKRRYKRKPRMISLTEEDDRHVGAEPCKISGNRMEICRVSDKSNSGAGVPGNLFELEIPEMAESPV